MLTTKNYLKQMDVAEKLSELGERVASVETTVAHLDNQIHQLRRAFHKSDFNPLWLRVMIIINGFICAWLTVLSIAITNVLRG